MFAQRGTNDDFYAEYPATPEEALAAEQLDRRIPLDWLQKCLDTELAVWDGWMPAVPGLVVWQAPVARKRYVIGAVSRLSERFFGRHDIIRVRENSRSFARQ